MGDQPRGGPGGTRIVAPLPAVGWCPAWSLITWPSQRDQEEDVFAALRGPSWHKFEAGKLAKRLARSGVAAIFG